MSKVDEVTMKREVLEQWKREAEENLRELAHVLSVAKDQERILKLIEEVQRLTKALERVAASDSEVGRWAKRALRGSE